MTLTKEQEEAKKQAGIWYAEGFNDGYNEALEDAKKLFVESKNVSYCVSFCQRELEKLKKDINIVEKKNES